MEAGHRSFDFNVPEELNRSVIDHIADFNLVYTEHAQRHLLSEGLPHRRIYLTGSPMKEVLDYYMTAVNSSKALETLSLAANRYFVVSTHREENVDNPKNLGKILNVLNRLAEEYDMPVVVSTHPRTRKRMEDLSDKKNDNRLLFMKPFGFLDYINLQKNAICTISDSGIVSEESSIIDFPAISLRQSMERPEAQDAGTIILSGLAIQTVLDSVRLCIYEHNLFRFKHVSSEYQIGDTSWRVLKLMMGNTHLSNRWHGIDK